MRVYYNLLNAFYLPGYTLFGIMWVSPTFAEAHSKPIAPPFRPKRHNSTLRCPAAKTDTEKKKKKNSIGYDSLSYTRTKGDVQLLQGTAQLRSTPHMILFEVQR